MLLNIYGVVEGGCLALEAGAVSGIADRGLMRRQLAR